MQELTLDVILRAVFGTSDARLAADIRDTLASRARCRAPPRCRWPARPRAAQPVGSVPAAHGRGRRAAHGAHRGPPRTGAGGDDILAQLLAAGLDDAELRDHLVTLLAAGTRRPPARWPGRWSAWPARRTSSAHVRAGDEAGSTP
jgi:cytochrome P450